MTATELSDEELVRRFPRSEITFDSRAFFRGLLDHTLLINRCDACGRWHQPPKPRCPYCWSDALRPTPVRGKGRIFTVLHLGPPVPGVDYSGGYPVAVVDLDDADGVRSTSTVIGSSGVGPVEVGPSQLTIGAPVTLDWIERDGAPLPVFRLAGGEADFRLPGGERS